MLAGLKFVGLSALGARLYYLSVTEGEKYRLRADKNRISLRLIAPERGEIMDRNGHILATNKQDYRIFLIPEQAEDVDGTLTELSNHVEISDNLRARIQRQMKRQRKFVPVTVTQNLDWQSFARVNASMHDLPGVLPDSGLTRDYPNGEATAHIVGYVASPREEDAGRNTLFQLPGFKVGREGLEKVFDDRLRGKAGHKNVEVNSVGREIRELPPVQDAVVGNDLQLTIDVNLQQYCQDRLGENSAGVVVMDVHTGQIVALASAPTFDPAEFSRGMSIENWNAMLQDPRKPLLNKCLSGSYPPGSTMKMVVALAALEKGIITPETEFFCNGRHRLGNHTFHCWHRGHGRLDLVNAIARSCDVYFYRIAEKLDVDDIAAACRLYGLEQDFDIALENIKTGLVPDRRWKRVYRNENWHLGETLNVSIGQGAMLATPLQLAVMTARLATGKQVLPQLIRDAYMPTDFESLGSNPNHLQTVRRGMEMVMEQGGTAHYYTRSDSPLKVAGKTGTAQVRNITKAERDAGVLDNDEKPWAARDHALFVGYAPAENPQFAVSVLVQHGGGGSSVAAPIGRDVLDKAVQLYPDGLPLATHSPTSENI